MTTHLDNRYHALDSLRGVCALSVVVHHMHIADTFTEVALFRNAHLFVEFFFVLSGFVIAHTYGYRKDIDFRTFLITRTTRLLPLHLFMLFVFVILELGKLLASLRGIGFTSPAFTGPTALSEILPNALLLQSWTPYTQYLSFNYPSWSISIEYYVYIIFFITTVICRDHKTRAWLAIATAFLIASYNNMALPTEAVVRGLSCFFAGACTYVLARAINKASPPGRYTASLLELTAIASTLLIISSDYAHKGFISSLIFCAAVLVFSHDRGIVSSLLSLGPLRYLGRISYSIYMTHAAILFIATSVYIIFEKISGQKITLLIGTTRHLDTGNLILNNLLGLATLAIVIMASALTYQLIEVNGQRLGKYILARRKEALAR